MAPPNPARILVVDDEQDILQAAQLLLKRHFVSVQTSSDPASLPERVRQNSFDVLLLDMNFAPGSDEGAEGLKWLAQVLAVDPQAVVVLVTARSGVELAVQAMKQGAADFVTKPWENERLLATLLAAANLRRSRIDELPQLINILKGDMSFVGPRPERPMFVEELAEQIPLYRERHMVKAGLTGWAQVNYPYGASVDDARSKLSYDLYYVKNRTLWLDGVIMARAVWGLCFPRRPR